VPDDRLRVRLEQRARLFARRHPLIFGLPPPQNSPDRTVRRETRGPGCENPCALPRNRLLAEMQGHFGHAAPKRAPSGDRLPSEGER
jgi:hypothetical protein